MANPCIIDQDVDLDDVVPKLVWAKYLNAGQTCVVPDCFCTCKYCQTVFSESQRTYSILLWETEEQQLQSAHFMALIDEASFTHVQQLTQASIQQAELITGLKKMIKHKE